jgi:AmmeMemoRadiSam system protein B
MNVRPPAVAGLFYPADPHECAATVDAMLADAIAAGERASHAKAFVVPHAGYVYSGPIAATAYAALLARRDEITRVVLLGPAHRVPLEGLALPGVDAWRTPLGDVPIDQDARELAANLPGVTIDDRPHAEEHSLEVQLPFLQRVLGQFTLVPFVVGHASAPDVARVIDALWGGPETIVLVSSDLSHYESYPSAAHHDRATANAVLAGAADEIGPYDACGAYPLRGLLGAARHHDLVTALLDLRSSGDTAGPRDRVVGYGAFALTPAGATS